MTSHAKTYNNGFPLNGSSCWVPVGGVDKSIEGLGKAVGFFSLPVEGVEKRRWEISPKPLDTLEKAVGFFSVTR